MNSLLSIDLGSQNLHIVEGSFQKNVLKVLRMGSFPVPEDCMKGDVILDVDEVANTLINGIKSFGSKSKEVAVTINAISSLIRDVELPLAKPKELEGMIRNELMQSYHVTDNHEIQYKLIESVKAPDGAAMNRYRAIALELPVIESHYRLVLKAKKKPIAMDVNINAIDKLLSLTNQVNEKPLDTGASMFIDFGHRSTTIYIYSKGLPLFYRHLNMGSGEIEKIISEEILSSVEEVRALKESGLDLFNDDEKAKTYFQYLRPYFYSFNDEMRKIVSFYSARNKGITVERAYLFGGGGRLAGLPGYWESNLNIPVETVQTISSLNLPQDHKDLGLYLNSIGALIRY